jgi:hypothetical protein
MICNSISRPRHCLLSVDHYTVARFLASSYPTSGRILVAFLPEALHSGSCAVSHDPSAERLVAPCSFCRTAKRHSRSPRCATAAEREMYFWPHTSSYRPTRPCCVVSTFGIADELTCMDSHARCMAEHQFLRVPRRDQPLPSYHTAAAHLGTHPIGVEPGHLRTV